jgi:hypothetical protein
LTETNQPELKRSSTTMAIWHNPVVSRLSLAETLLAGSSATDGGNGSTFPEA